MDDHLPEYRFVNAFLKKSQPAELPLREGRNRALYFSLLDSFSWPSRKKSELASTLYPRDFLVTRIEEARGIDVDFPSSLAELEQWCEDGFAATGLAYQRYLSERRAGSQRRYFTSRSHAIDFLNKSAPTKLVDGSWLYGVLPQWSKPEFSDLIRTYLEELGDGQANQNHVALYRRLLAAHDCDSWSELDDEYFIQGAIQLALASQAEHFLPEIIGFNLGYEQLPLHLLITAHELSELGIDPYYFTLHITIDNFDNGHARRALATVKAIAAHSDNEAEFFERVRNGYRLNFVGAGAAEIIDSFDLERQVIDLFTRKAAVGQYLHCDRCKIQGRTINEWLAQPAGIPDLLQAFEATGWIKRNEDPANSRFWTLIEGEQPLMFGVFDAREKQLIFDWISGDWIAPRKMFARGRTRPAAELSLVAPSTVAPSGREADAVADTRSSQRRFAAELRTQPGRTALLNALISDMSPALHDSERGLVATRIFADYFYGRSPSNRDQHAFMLR